MDIIKILSTIKGKVLDAEHFEILQHVYELQNQNIEQLKNNNSALKESNNLLKEKNDNLEKENSELKKRIVFLENELTLKKSTELPQKLSEVAEAILRKCMQEDITNFNDKNMIRSLPYSKIEIEAGIDELSHLKLVHLGSVQMMGGGANYYLTTEGMKFVLKLQNKIK